MDSGALDEPLSRVLGAKTAAALSRAIGIDTVGGLLAYYPRRYALRGELTALAEVPLGVPVSIVAEVLQTSTRRMQKRRGSILEVTITDGVGALTLTFFNQPWRENDLKPGVRGIFSGKVTRYRQTLQLAHPDYELFTDDATGEEDARRWAEAPVPIYAATAALPTWKIHTAISTLLDVLGPVPDPVPEQVRARHGLLPLRDALFGIHRPETVDQLTAARATLKFGEAYVLQAALIRARSENDAQAATPRVAVADGLLTRFDEDLPFELTAGQREVAAQISHDLARPHPMNRLLQGEVGSGKTVVALRAMLIVAESGGQSALLAPTEVLAAQHFASIVELLGPDLAARVHPVLITGGQGTAERRRAALAAAAGQALIVVGTHALLSDSTMFYELGLVIVDEQHRFGVAQRDVLKAKAPVAPHVLMLTATPIPRTVAMTVFGDLAISSLHELPAGRAPIETFVVPLAEKPGWAPRLWQRLAEEVAAGRQGYVVAGLIDEDDAGERASVSATVDLLQANPATRDLAVGVLTGRMKSAEKNTVMAAFAAGEYDVLVATTVIEVGVNVPNASIMIVLDADRFGISQLHQLRGRIGRGTHPGIALFATEAPAGTVARERLDAVAATTDGFALAEADLAIRHEGDVLGAAQSGSRSSLAILNVARDVEVIAAARADAEAQLRESPDLSGNPALAAAIRRQVADEQEHYLTAS